VPALTAGVLPDSLSAIQAKASQFHGSTSGASLPFQPTADALGALSGFRVDAQLYHLGLDNAAQATMSVPDENGVIGGPGQVLHFGLSGANQVVPVVIDAQDAGFGQVWYKNVLDGVDELYYGSTDSRFIFDFVVRPGSDPSQLVLSYRGQQSLQTDSAGNLLIGMSDGQIAQTAPVAFQIIRGQVRTVASSYVLGDNGAVRFQTSDYDHSEPLIIDPTQGTPTTTTMTSNTPNPSAFGQQVTLSAKVKVTSSGSAVTIGNVTFNCGSVALEPAV